MSLKIGNVEVQGQEIRVTVSGKTGTRSFLMNQFAPVLKHWLNFHPHKRDPSSPLWTRLCNRGRPSLGTDEGVTACLADELLKRYAKRAGINKPVSMHWLRHSKVTWTARNRKRRINDKLANSMFGWSPRSNKYGHYTHIHGTDTDDAFRELEGIETTEKKPAAPILGARKCLNCNTQNTAESLYCIQCGCVLDEGQARLIAEREKLIEAMLKELKSKSQKTGSL